MSNSKVTPKITQKDLASEIAAVVNTNNRAELKQLLLKTLRAQLTANNGSITTKDAYSQDFNLVNLELDEDIVNVIINSIFESIYSKLQAGVAVSVKGGSFKHRLVPAGTMKVGEDKEYTYPTRFMPTFAFSNGTKKRVSILVPESEIQSV